MAAPKRWWLSGGNRWGEDLSHGSGAGSPGVPTAPAVVVSEDGVRRGSDSLTLAALPGGPYDPLASPETVGGLAYPRNVVVGDSILVADGDRFRIVRVSRSAEPESRPWLALPGTLEAGPGPVALAQVGALLVAARVGGRRVTALHPQAELVYGALELPTGWTVADLCAQGDSVAVLARPETGRGGRVRCWRPGSGRSWILGAVPPGPRRRWVDAARLIRDGTGAIHVLDGRTGRLALVEPGSRAGTWRSASEVRELFPALELAFEPHGLHDWRFRIPPLAGTATRWPAPSSWPAFSSLGRPLHLPPEAPVGPPPYQKRGVIEIGPLDSSLPRTVWDRVELSIQRLGAGTAVELQTFTSDEPDAPPSLVSAGGGARGSWSEAHRLAGAESGGTPDADFAVVGPVGRFLWLRLTLHGGADTAELHSVTVHYPRQGLVDYLPEVFRAADEDTRFLERLVGTLEATWEPMESSVEGLHRQLIPETADGSDMLDYLGAWFDEPMRPEWSVASRRQTVRQASDDLLRRGTPSAVQAAVRVHLANRWSAATAELGGVPFLWEHFRSRSVATLDPAASGGGDRAATPGRLFGAEVFNRLRLGSTPVGTGKLQDRGSPETDPFTQHAHRFSVFVPRALVPDEDALRQVEDVLRRESPASAVAGVEVVEARMRVGVQATLGVDTLLGIYPEPRLAAGPDEGFETPAARLGYDTLLAEGETERSLPSVSLGGDGGTLPWRLT